MSEEQPQLWLSIRLPEYVDDAELEIVRIRTRAKPDIRWTTAFQQSFTKNTHWFLVELPPGMPDTDYVGRLKLELAGYGNRHPVPTRVAERMRNGAIPSPPLSPDFAWSTPGTPASEAEQAAVGLTNEPEIQVLLQTFLSHLSQYQKKHHSRYVAKLGNLTPQESLDFVLSKWSWGDQGFADWLWRTHFAQGEPAKRNKGIEADDQFWVAAKFPDEPEQRLEALRNFKVRSGRVFAIRRPTQDDSSAFFLSPVRPTGPPSLENVKRTHKKVLGWATPEPEFDNVALEEVVASNLHNFLPLVPFSAPGTPAFAAEVRIPDDMDDDLLTLGSIFLGELSRYQDPASDTYNPELAKYDISMSFELILEHWEKGDRGFAKWLADNFKPKPKHGFPSTPRRKDASIDAYSSESVTLEDGSKATIVTSGHSGISALFRGNTLIESGPRASLLPKEGH